MKCEEFLSLLPMAPDAFDSAQDASGFRAHAAECKECAARLAEHEMMLASLKSLDDTLTPPEGFGESWRAAIRKETRSSRLGRLKDWRAWTAVAAATVLIVSGTAMMRGGWLFPASGPDKQAAVQSTAAPPESMPLAAKYAPEAPLPAAMPGDAYGGAQSDAYHGEPALNAAYEADMAADSAPLLREEMAGSGMPEPATESIMLTTASISLNTDQYDTDLSRVDELLAAAGGWSEYWSVAGDPVAVSPDAGRYASMTFRVPMQALDSFVTDVSAIGKVTVQEMVAEDISGSYYDVQGRLAMYETQRDRLTELLEKAAAVSDIVEIEGRLSEVQYTIETLVAQLNHWNSRENNAIVHLSVTEVLNLNGAKEGFWANAGETFTRSLKTAGGFFADMAYFLVMAMPYAVFAAAIAWGILLAVRSRKKHKTHQRSHEE